MGLTVVASRHGLSRGGSERVRRAAKTLPERTVLDPVADDEGDDLTASERKALHASIRESLDQAREGRIIDGAEIVAELRERRRGLLPG
jgi:hypothetical protein